MEVEYIVEHYKQALQKISLKKFIIIISKLMSFLKETHQFYIFKYFMCATSIPYGQTDICIKVQKFIAKQHLK